MYSSFQNSETKILKIIASGESFQDTLDTIFLQLCNNYSQCHFGSAFFKQDKNEVHDIYIPILALDSINAATNSSSVQKNDFQEQIKSCASKKDLEYVIFHDALNMHDQSLGFLIILSTDEIKIEQVDISIASNLIALAIKNEVQKRELKNVTIKAQNANRVKSDFLSNMSHEIRTPLTSILGFANAMTSDNLSEQDAKIALHSISRNSEHLLQIMNDIIDISKIEAGKLEIESTTFLLMQSIDDVFSIVKLKAEEKGIELQLQHAFPLPKLITTDQLRFKQILLNLIGNAIKFTNVGTVELTVGYDQPSNQLLFEIVDTGIGITEKQQQQIFKAFSQADTSITRRFGGSGLGLTICKELTSRLGGVIDFKSSKDQGTTFRFSIDAGAMAKHELQNSLQIPTIPQTKNKNKNNTDYSLNGKVLLIEDGEDNQLFISYLLKKIGLEYRIAENGLIGVQQAINSDFDLILMDLQMPVMDGFIATKILRNKSYTKPIIALTANITREASVKCFEMGCDDYLSKPFKPHVFYEKLALYLNQPMMANTKKLSGEKSKEDGIVIPDIQPCDIQATELDMKSLHPILPVFEEDPPLIDRTLLISYIEKLPNRLEECEKAYNANDWLTLGKLAHRMAGAQMYGYPDLTQVSIHLENSVNANQHASIHNSFKNLRTIIHAIVLGREHIT